MAKKALNKKKVRRDTIYWLWLVGSVFVVLLVIIMASWIFLKNSESKRQKVTITAISIKNNLTDKKDSGHDELFPQFNEREWLQADKVYASVMIDNHFTAWDSQYGLSSSPLVYNAPVEGGVTRFLALFPLDSDLERIGPIRSVRPYFLDLFPEHASVLVHVGGSPEALSIIEKKKLPDLNEMTSAGAFFNRDKNFIAPHNTFISSKNLAAAIDYFNYKKIKNNYSFKFGNMQATSTQGRSIYIDYSAKATYDVEYKYNDDFSAYERWRAGERQVDALTQYPVLVDNIIIQKVPSEVILDKKLRIALDVLGEGEALFFINSHKIKGTWKKQLASEPTYYYDSEGKEIIFKPGNVWIEVVPEGHEVISDN